MATLHNINTTKKTNSLYIPEIINNAHSRVVSKHLCTTSRFNYSNNHMQKRKHESAEHCFDLFSIHGIVLHFVNGTDTSFGYMHHLHLRHAHTSPTTVWILIRVIVVTKTNPIFFFSSRENTAKLSESFPELIPIFYSFDSETVSHKGIPSNNLVRLQSLDPF